MNLFKFSTVLLLGAWVFSTAAQAMPVMHTVDFPQQEKKEFLAQQGKAKQDSPLGAEAAN